MQVYEIKKEVYWVGAVDWLVRDFHGYSTYRGSTYNAYLMLDEKNVLFDTVKHDLCSDLAHRIRTVIDPEKIDYIVVNHVEMDHTGSLPEIIDMVKPEKIICSKMGHKNRLDHFHRPNWPYHVVKDGETIHVGKRSIHFMETKMLHWPDSMFSYVPEEKLLIAQDAFGQHLGTSERFDDEVDLSELMCQAKKYYANILYLYSPQVRKLLKAVAESGIEIDMIAPDHGVIWRSHMGRILKAYEDWSSHKCSSKAVVVYDTMWHSTEMMAKAISDGIESTGVSMQLLDLSVNHRSDVMTEVLDAKGVCLGCPTLNNGMLPRMAGFLLYMKGLRPARKLGMAFGSFGWSGEAVKHMTKAMEEMKFDIVHDGIRVKYVPTHEGLKACAEAGRLMGQKVKEARDKEMEPAG